MSSCSSHKIKARESPNDVVLTPRQVAKNHIDYVIENQKDIINKNDMWLDPCRYNEEGAYYSQFKQYKEDVSTIFFIDYCEITEGKDFFEHSHMYHNDLIIIGNPPYSLLNKWFEKTISLKPKIFSYLIGVHNLTCKRIEMAQEAGYRLANMQWFKVYDYYGMSMFVTFVMEDKPSIIDIDRTVYRKDN